jgi:hypothetical protein
LYFVRVLLSCEMSAECAGLLRPPGGVALPDYVLLMMLF